MECEMEPIIDIVGSSGDDSPIPCLDPLHDTILAELLGQDAPLEEPSPSAGAAVEVTVKRRNRRQKTPRRTSKRARKQEDAVQREESEPVEVDLNRLGHRSYCTICGQAGDLEYCDACPRAFHAACLLKSKLKAPKQASQWTCHLCHYFLQVETQFFSNSASEDVEQQCQILLDHILQNDLSAEFVVPIPESDREYHSIIKSPMDLTTIRIRLSRGHYRRSISPGLRKPFGGLLRFIDDVLNVWCNALGYNMPKSAVHRQSESLQRLTKRYVEEPLFTFWSRAGHKDFEQQYRQLVRKWQAEEEAISSNAISQANEAPQSPTQPSRRGDHSKRRKPGSSEAYPTTALENEASLPVGLARTIPKGARFVKNFLGKHYWGIVKQYNDPYFLCVYEDGDQEDLGREEIDKYLADTYKLLLAGIVKPPKQGWT